MGRSQRLWQEVHKPEAARIATPRSVEVTSEAVHKDDIHCRIFWTVYRLLSNLDAR